MDSKYLRYTKKTMTDAYTDVGDDVGKSKMGNKNNVKSLFKNNNKGTTPERRQWRRSGVFIVNFKHISLIFHTVYWIYSVRIKKTQWETWCKIVKSETLHSSDELAAPSKDLSVIWEHHSINV